MISNKIISFSLWGSDPKYCIGAFKNCLLANKYFPDWIIHIHHNDSVSEDCLESLDCFNNVILKEHSEGFGAFWRFESMQPGSIVISRDTDSRLSLREKKIVDEWLESNKKMCVIRDHLNHYEFPIMAGMFGIKNGLSKNLFDNMKQYTNIHQYLSDQIYLKDHVWPAYQNDCMSFGIKETIWMKESYKNIGKHFIGQTYTEKDDTVYEPAI